MGRLSVVSFGTALWLVVATAACVPAGPRACRDFGLAPGTPEFARCQSGETQRANSAQRAVTGTLFRSVTMAPAR